MLKKLTILALVFFILILACSDTAKQVQFEKKGVVLKDLQKKADDESKMIMIDFYTEWCVWCKVLDDSTYTDPRVISLSKKFINFKVDAEKEEGPSLIRRYEVMGYPTILFVDKNGNEVDRWIGYATPAVFAKKLKEVLDGKETFLALQQAYKANNQDPEVAFKWGWKVADRNNAVQAKYIWEKILKNDPENKNGNAAKVLFAITHVEQDENKIDAIFLKLINEFPDFENIFEVYKRSIRKRFEAKEYAEALKLVDQAIEKFSKPNELADLYYIKGIITQETKDYAASISALKLVDVANNRNLLISVNQVLFDIYYLVGDTSQITATTNKTLELPLSKTEKGDFILAVMQFANRTSYAGRALEYAEMLSDATTDPIEVAIAKANLFNTLQKYPEIEKTLVAAYPAAKNDAIKLNFLAWSVVKMQQNLKVAHDWAQEAIQLSDSASYILDTYAELLALNKEYAGAIKIEKAALRRVNLKEERDGFESKIRVWEKML